MGRPQRDKKSARGSKIILPLSQVAATDFGSYCSAISAARSVPPSLLRQERTAAGVPARELLLAL